MITAAPAQIIPAAARTEMPPARASTGRHNPSPATRSLGEVALPGARSKQRADWMSSLNIRTPDPNQAKVFHEADPDRHGTIIKAGKQQYEVRLDDGEERIVPTVCAASINWTSPALNLKSKSKPQSVKVEKLGAGSRPCATNLPISRA